ncbi:hypothetical protein ACVWWN_004547 [Mycobacterium sp. URHB0021]
MWAKLSTSTASVACAACVAAAVTVALPVMGAAAEQVVKVSNADVKLTADFDALSGLNAIPAYVDLLGGDLSGLAGLDGVNGIFAYAALLGGDPSTAASSLAATDGIPSYLGAVASAAAGDARGVVDTLGDIDGFSALPVYADLLSGKLDAVADLDSVNGLPAYLALLSGDPLAATSGLSAANGFPSLLQFIQTGNLDAFLPTDTNAGYAALGALRDLGNGLSGNLSALGNIDAFSAIQALLAPSPSVDEDAAGTASQMSLVAAPEQTSDPLSGPASAGNLLRSLLKGIRAAIPKPPARPQPPVKSAVAPDAAPQTDQTEPKGSVADPKPQAQPVAVKAPDGGRQGQQTKTETKTTLDDGGSGAQAVGKHSPKTSPGSTSNTAVRSGAGKHRADNGMRSGGSSAKKQGIGGGAAGSSSRHPGGSHRKGGASRHHTGAKGGK